MGWDFWGAVGTLLNTSKYFYFGSIFLVKNDVSLLTSIYFYLLLNTSKYFYSLRLLRGPGFPPGTYFYLLLFTSAGLVNRMHVKNEVFSTGTYLLLNTSKYFCLLRKCPGYF